VVRVPPHSTSPVVVADGLSFTNGFAAGPDGSLYVSNWSIAPAYTGLGSVVRVTP
jgi:sugar lactone lactonase YvrE